MGQKSRAVIPDNVIASVLTKSARRCAFCYALSHDLTEKLGQIANIDRDASNATETNLAFLCFDHHSTYDSTTRQHKNYTPRELTAAREALHRAIADGMHRTVSPGVGGRGGSARFRDHTANRLGGQAVTLRLEGLAEQVATQKPKGPIQKRVAALEVALKPLKGEARVGR